MVSIGSFGELRGNGILASSVRQSKLRQRDRALRRGPEFVRIEKSYEISWAAMLGLWLALDRKCKAIGLEEYFSGVYLIARDALVPYWIDSSSLDEFVRDVCGLTEPAVYYWIEFHQAMKAAADKGAGLIYSKEAVEVLNYAARLALKTKKGSKNKSQLRIEHVMIALAAHPRLKFTRRLLASRMNLGRCEAGL